MATDAQPWSKEDVERAAGRWPEGTDLRSSLRGIMDEAVAIAESNPGTLADAKLGRALVARLGTVVGDTGMSESAEEVLDRLLTEHKHAKQ